MTEKPKIWTVSALNRKLRKLIDEGLEPLWLSGEVTDLKIHQSGHVYLSLKDQRGQIAGVLFNGAALARRLGLENGMEAEVFGKVRVYEQRGAYQIYIEEIRPGGLGQLQRQFEELKRKLEKEGLFDPARKRPIPEAPACIGVITSLTGAALRDFLQVVNRRFPNLHIRIVDARMQGAEAALQVVRAIRYLNREEACNVIVITRGGGSMEDLWCFNDEQLVRQVATSTIPVISAIGHETDFTLCDYAADLRAPTPSAAAELVIGRQAEYLERLRHLTARLVNLLALQYGQLQGRYERAAGHYLFRQPEQLLAPRRQRLDELAASLDSLVRQQLDQAGQRLEKAGGQLRLLSPVRQLAALAQQLKGYWNRLALIAGQNLTGARSRLARSQAQLMALNPKNVLSRGYSILIGEKDGGTVLKAAQVSPGDHLKGVLSEGEIKLEVRE